jgi:transcriptional regulator
MHPNSAFRIDDRALHETLIEQVGFGMVFAATPDGPRVAHVPIVSTGDGALHFHLARGNGLTRHLDGMTALAVINGPDAYVSPRWYGDPGQVPTWNYVALECEGRVRKLAPEGLLGHLEQLVAKYESRVPEGEPWTLDRVPPERLRQLQAGIVGFEMEVQAWRPTFKLSQNKSAEDRARVTEALEAHGSPALAALMRSLAP